MYIDIDIEQFSYIGIGKDQYSFYDDYLSRGGGDGLSGSVMLYEGINRLLDGVPFFQFLQMPDKEFEIDRFWMIEILQTPL